VLTTSRRRFFALGAGSAALLATGGVLSWWTAGYSLRAGEVALGLSPKAFCVARAITEVLCQGSEGLSDGVAAGVVQRIDEEVWSAEDAVRVDLEDALQLLEHLPPWFGFTGRFSKLGLDDREACFLRFLQCDDTVIVRAATALKQMAHFFHFAGDGTWGAIGYDGPWVAARKLPESGVRYRQLYDEARGVPT
jgi:hypothetical protein